MKGLFRKSTKPPPPVQQPLARYPASSEPAHIRQPHLQPKYTLPPVPHPFPHHRVALLVTPEGLLLRPVIAGVETPNKHVRIRWGKDIEVQEIEGDSVGHDWSHSATVFGVVGFLKLFSESCMLVIVARTDIGNFLHPSYPVYGVKSVVSIPLTESRARTVVNSIAIRYQEHALPTPGVGSVLTPYDSNLNNKEEAEELTGQKTRVKFSDNNDVKVMTPNSVHEFPVERSPPSSVASSGASTPTSDADPVVPVAQALASRLSFWSRLSKKQAVSFSALEEDEPLRDAIDDMDGESIDSKDALVQDIINATAPAPATIQQKHSEVDDKVVKECIREYTKGDMFFAYNFDITTSLQHKQQQIRQFKHPELASGSKAKAPVAAIPDDDDVDVLAEANPTLPLWRRVDRQFWWNEHMLYPFMDAGLHSYVLPIMQGFYQITSFRLEPSPDLHLYHGPSEETALIDYIIISRRSRERAGLRYQRRGVDDDANVANFVETETVMRVEREGMENVFSYVQIRGSIPVFWTQTGYGLKPPPILSPERTHEQHLSALKRHFKKTLPRYGYHTIVNLAEQRGKEEVVTTAYRNYTRECGLKDVQYTEYDFHAETKGMKYENIGKLIDSMEKTFNGQGYFWVSGNKTLYEQKGVFRVNCIDCLDRTNVVQSAFGRYILTKQLSAIALMTPTDAGRTEIDIVFNDVWANNGDAISRAYAGTSALKGDFTRTGKRDIGGMLNDGMNSIARMYSSTFSDWFSQAVIDFMLGYRTLSVFSEFLLKLQSTDPRERIRISKIRAEAVAESVSRVLSEGERLLSGWTLFAPVDLDTKFGEKFEEKVLLLTVDALYIVSYDYSLEKVAKYTRVPLSDIVSITKGAYILSPLEEGSRDPVQNHGFLVSFLNGGQVTRLTSYCVRNSTDLGEDDRADALSTMTSETLRAATLPRKGPSVLSRLLSNASVRSSHNPVSFAAFKALPIDPARSRRGTGSFDEYGDDLSGATTCKEAVSVIVDAIRRAREDVAGTEDFSILEADIVSLAEAQRMTTVYAKMEYGLKRLLWLGG